MFKLLNPNLPVTTTTGQGGASVCRVFNPSSPYLAPIAHINVLAPYQSNPNFGGVTVNLPAPKNIGAYYRFDLGYSIKNIEIAGFTLIDNPISAKPGDVWIEETTINLYADKNYPVVVPFKFNVTVIATVPPPTNNIFVIGIPSGFTVASGESECLYLSPDIIDQQGNVVSINTPLHLLNVGDVIELVGEQTYFDVTPKCALAQFDLSHTEVRLLYSVEFMGSVFSPAIDVRSPQIGEFLWGDDLQYVTIFSKELVY